jgi:ferredoxin
MTINYKELSSLFPEDKWDIGVLKDISYKKVLNKPVKAACHFRGEMMTNRLQAPYQSNNTIVLARASEVAADYSLYEEANQILKKYIDTNRCIQVYLNFKEAAIYSGIGVRAKNSLIYNKKFGFQCKLCAFTFLEELTDYTEPVINEGLLDICDGCSDCIVNCPAKAIYEDFIDGNACDTFVGVGNNDKQISIKWFWYELVKPNIPREIVESWNTLEDFNSNIVWANGYEMTPNGLMKDGKVIEMPLCRMCQEQPRCSKRPIDSI